jgi:hypothetical protein
MLIQFKHYTPGSELESAEQHREENEGSFISLAISIFLFILSHIFLNEYFINGNKGIPSCPPDFKTEKMSRIVILF